VNQPRPNCQNRGRRSYLRDLWAVTTDCAIVFAAHPAWCGSGADDCV